MMRYVAPLEQTLRHVSLPKPKVKLPAIPRRAHPTAMTKQHGGDDQESVKTSQLLAEHAAAIIGSWRFLIIQACVLATWVLLNALRIAGFDPQPFILLNLLLSFQAAFTGPVLLIAANVGAVRDHAQFGRMERLVKQNEELTERLAALEENILARLDAQMETPQPPARRRRKAAD